MKKIFAVLWAFAVLLAIIIAVSCSKSSSPTSPSEEESYTVTGVVREGNSGLAGVSVLITGKGVNQTATTDSNGAYTFQNLANGTYTITPSKSDYTFKPASATVTISGSNKTDEIFMATKAGSGYTISGVIQESNSGLAGVSVRVTGNGVDQTAITDSNGAYTFGGLANGNYTITPSKSDYTFNPVSIAVTMSGSGRVVETIIATKAGYAITGIIREGDFGLAGVSVRVTGNGVDQTAITDSNGAYTFQNLANGTYTITPSKSDYTFKPASATVTISGSDKALEIIIATKVSSGPHEIPDITFVSIPSGTFQMGDVEGGGYLGEVPVHTVTISSFEMSIYEVTNAQYAVYLNEALSEGDITVFDSNTVLGKGGEYDDRPYWCLYNMTPSYNMNGITYSAGKFGVEPGKENWPAESVSWYGAKAFAQYYGLDLPTEAEWEYACRGGKQYKYGTDDGTISPNKANYGLNIEHSVDVGSYPANPFGLYDMCGNAYEWCNDWYGSYSSSNITDPVGPSSGSYRVLRSGCWWLGGFAEPAESEKLCRSANRHHSGPFNFYGFRVVRRPNGKQYLFEN